MKLTILVAMLVGLVNYSRSSASSLEPGPSLPVLQRVFARNGYRRTAEESGDRGLTTATYELTTSTQPHFHRTVLMYITSRGDHVLDISHDETGPELPD